MRRVETARAGSLYGLLSDGCRRRCLSRFPGARISRARPRRHRPRHRLRASRARPHQLLRPGRDARRTRPRWDSRSTRRRSSSRPTTPAAASATTCSAAKCLCGAREVLPECVEKPWARSCSTRRPTHVFEIGRFREETMAFPPGVTVKDYTWNGSAGYLNPKQRRSAGAFPVDHSDRTGATGAPR